VDRALESAYGVALSVVDGMGMAKKRA